MLIQLTDVLKTAFVAEGIDPSLAVIIPSEKPELADFQCNGVRAAAGRARQNPVELAQRIVQHIDDPRAEFSIAGPGFINIRIKAPSLEVLVAKAYRPEFDSKHKRIVIDFGGPNVAKPMHVGHLRSLVIGDSLQRILRFAGFEVISDIHLGDWGLQMGLLLAALEGTPLSEIDLVTLEEIYPLATSLAKKSSGFKATAQRYTHELQSGKPERTEMWRHFVRISLAEIERELQRMQIGFTVYDGESDVQQIIPMMIEDFVRAGLAKEDGGALVVETSDPPLILRKSDGASLYATTDLATILDRVAGLHPDQIIYVTDDRQTLHFKQVFAAAVAAGFTDADKLTHISFGTVNGADGKPLKTRDGGVPKLVDLINSAIDRAKEKNPDVAEQVALAALKFADLQTPRSTAYIFDLDRFLSFEGKTGPYLLYQAVRIKSILAKSVEPGAFKIEDEAERQLAVKLAFGFPLAVEQAIIKLSPKEIADHVYDLAQSFSKYYSTHTISDNNSRVALAIRVLEQLEKCLSMLGIEIPDKM
jgi:arginyl-tRNA synthetase